MLFARYDIARLKREVDRDSVERRPGSMWRSEEKTRLRSRGIQLLPVQQPENVITLGEGGTPLLEAANLGKKLGLSRLLVKEEGLNPTGTFKARGMSAAISRARELGATGFSMPSAGNAAGAASSLLCPR